MKPTARIAIDLNVRYRGNDTYSGFEHIQPGGFVTVGGEVEVFEAETGATGRGRVTAIDSVHRVVYMEVDWASIRMPPQFLLTRKPMPFELEILTEATSATLPFAVAA